MGRCQNDSVDIKSRGAEVLSVTVQIQSVLFNNQKTALVRTLENLQNAMRVDGETNQCVRDAVLIWGDASPAALFSEEEYRNGQRA